MRRAVLMFAGAALWCAAAEGASGWKAGLARTEITPREPVWMGGFASRTRPSEGVRQPIYARALALEDGAGKKVVLLTLDLVSLKKPEADMVVERAKSRFGLQRDRLAINLSHTHSGPVVGEPPYYVALTPEQAQAVKRYTERLIASAVETIGAALAKLEPAALSFEQGLAGIAVNRRRVGNRSYPAPVDHDVPVLAVRAPDGTLRAVVAGYACHATSMSDYLISGDWPGYALAEIEKRNPGATALFVAGCGADSNPLPRFGPQDPQAAELAASHGRHLAAAVELVLRGKMKPVEGPLATGFERIEIPYARQLTRKEYEERMNVPLFRNTSFRARLLEALGPDGKAPASLSYPVQAWRFGGGLKFVALAGEVVADYALRIKGEHGWNDTWVAGYSNEVFGYVPSRRVLAEGGYEGGDANRTLPGNFSPEIEEMILGAVGNVLRRAQ